MATKEMLFPFEGLHVYQRGQEAWTAALELAGADPLWELLEAEIQRAVLGIARATARSRSNGGFAAELEAARASVHAAAAVAEQLARRGAPVNAELRETLSFVSRALGALVRAIQPDRTEDGNILRHETDAAAEAAEDAQCGP